MRLTETAVKRGVTFAMIYLIAVGFGLFSLGRLKLDLYPKLEFPMIALITQYTGVGPFDMETVVTRPLEETVSIVENVKKVTSQSAQGVSLVSVEFEWGTDMNQAESDVRNALQWVEDILPDDVSEPLIFAFDVSMSPIMYYSVVSELHGPAELRKISQHEIEPRLERIPGVASAATSGGMAREIQIQVDPLRLRAYNLSIQQVSQALQMNNLQLPAGYIENEHQEFSIQTSGEYASVEEIENTSIMAMGGVNIRVKDVATVEDGFKEERQRIWTNGQPSVMLWVQRQSDANTVKVCRDVAKAVPQIEAELPKGVTLELFMDSSTFIQRSMANLSSTGIQAILFAFLVLLFFLGNFRTSIIVALSIPISIILTFAVMDQVELTLNVISMAGLALAVGMLIDNSIVVIESIFRFRERGDSPTDAANKGTSEVAMAITASTLTTLSVFLPVLFVPGLAGQMFKEMVLTICFSLAVSLIVALTLIPLLSSRFIKVADENAPKNGFKKLAEKAANSINRLRDRYVKWLDWSLNHRKTIIFSTLGLFFISLFLLGALGGEFMPEGDDGFIAISVDRSPGISLDQMDKTMREINDILNEDVPEGEYTYSSFGQGEGILAFFSSRSAAEGDINVRLPSVTERDRSKDDIKEALRDKFSKIPDATITFADRGQAAMMGSAGDIVVNIIGHDLQLGEALANEIKDKVDQIEGVVFTESSIKDSRPELRINLDRNRIADLGLSTAQVGQTVSTSVLGSVVTRYREGGDEYDVRVQLAKDSRESKEDIENILIMTPMGRQIPLRAIASIDYEKSPQEITREDQERFVSLNIDIEKSNQLGAVTTEVNKILKDTPIPNDYRFEISGTAEDMQESFMYLGLAILVAIILVYMVMASQFESLVDPFIILFTIPLALIGVVFGLLVTGTTLSVMALVGIVMLVGIVVNNGIVLVDYINQLRDRGTELFAACLEAGRVRMRPVLMTAMTTILAMLPMALGLGESGESWAPMARSVMGGLTVATILTLVVVPVIYASIEISTEKRKAKRAAKKEARMGKKLSLQEG